MTATVMVCATCFANDQSNNFQCLKQSGQIENLCHPFPKMIPEVGFVTKGLSFKENERWNDGCNYLLAMDARKDIPSGDVTRSNCIEQFSKLDKAIAKNEIQLLLHSKKELESVICANQTEQKELDQALKLVTNQIKERYEKIQEKESSQLNFQELKKSSSYKDICNPISEGITLVCFQTEGLSEDENDTWNYLGNRLLTLDAGKDIPKGSITPINFQSKVNEAKKAILKNEINLLAGSYFFLRKVHCENKEEKQELNSKIENLVCQIKDRYEEFKKLPTKPKSKIVAKTVSK